MLGIPLLLNQLIPEPKLKASKKLIFTFLAVLLAGIGLLKAQTYAISNIAGNQNYGFAGDGGLAVLAWLDSPMEVSADKLGNVYFSDWWNGRVRMINAHGIISTVAGNGVFGYSGDGGPATLAKINGPMGVFAESSGNILICDVGNGRIRSVSPAGIISTIAGNGAYGFAGDGGPATLASFRDPTAITEDTLGNIYIADVFNNRIRRIDHTTGIITTVAGCGTRNYSGDGGPATSAGLYYPCGVTLDDSGNIYIADADNFRIRKVTTSGTIYTVAGNGSTGYSGDNGPATSAQLNYPASIAVDNSGNIYIADANNNRIRKVNKQGIISTVAGDSNAGFSMGGDSATSESLYNPTSIVPGTQQNFYLVDSYNSMIRELTIAPAAEPQIEEAIIYPNPNYGKFYVKLLGTTGKMQMEVYNVLGQRVSYEELNPTVTQLDLSTQSKGIYLYRVINEENKVMWRGKVIVL